jgi:glycosyltransferase involved in cell wall biosynthesis
MNILTLSNYFPEHQGGIEFVAMNLVKHWRAHHRVRWMACEVQEYPHRYTEDDIPLPANNFTESNLGFPYPVPAAGSFFEIFKQVKECDVIHVHDCLYLANLVAFLASRRYRKPLFVTQHVAVVPYPQPYKNILQRVAYQTLGKLVLKNAQGIVFISERVKAWFEDQMRFPKEPKLIPNGVDREIFFRASQQERQTLRSELGLAANDLALLFVGRFTQKKGLGLIRELAQARPSIRWVLIGREELDPRAWNLPNVEVLPVQSQATLRKYYAATDLLFLPSVGEGLPLALQEALSCGLPAAVAHETANYLPDAPLLKIDPGSLPSLLQTLDDILSHRGQLTHLAAAAGEYAQRWEWAKVAAQYEILFANRILSG